jgi:hypothetical protein
VVDPLPTVPSDQSTQLIKKYAADFVRKARMLGAGDQAIFDAVTTTCGAPLTSRRSLP